MEAFNQAHAKMLYVRFCAIYGNKFVQSYHDEDFKDIWCAEWVSGLRSIDVKFIKDALEYCKTHMDWSPSIAEFKKVCERTSGIPSEGQCLAAAIHDDFSHPLTVMAYEKVGSWTMKNSKEAELVPKFKAAYQEALDLFRAKPDESWVRLETFNQRKALPPPPSKILTQDEIIGWRERMKIYEERSKADKLRLGEKAHPEWPKDKIIKDGRHFDPFVYNERKKYLLAIDEEVAITLSVSDKYDRICFLREIEALRHLERVGYTGRQPEPPKSPPRGYNKPVSGYKSWGKD